MKKLLSILATISIVSPVSGITTSAIVNSVGEDNPLDPRINEPSAVNITPFGNDYKSTKVSENVYSHDVANFGHEIKMSVAQHAGDKNNAYMYGFASNSYSVNENTIVPITYNQNGEIDTVSDGSSAIINSTATTPEDIQIGGKTFVVNQSSDTLSWVSRNQDGKLSFRDTGIKYKKGTQLEGRNNVQEFVPIQLIDDSGSTNSFIFTDNSAYDSTNWDELAIYNVDSSSSIYSKENISNIFPNVNRNNDGLIIKKGELLSQAGITDSSSWKMKSIIGLQDANTSDDLLNRVIIGFCKQESSGAYTMLFLEYNFSYDSSNKKISESIVKTPDNKLKEISVTGNANDNTNQVGQGPIVFSETSSGDIFVKVGTGPNITTFLGSYFLDGIETKVQKPNSIDDSSYVNPFLKAINEVDGFFKDYSKYIISDFSQTPIDRHTILEAKIYNDANHQQYLYSKFYGVDIDYSNGQISYNNVHWLFTIDQSPYASLTTLGHMITGSVMNGNNIDYNFIAMPTLNSKVIIYKYKFDNNNTSYGKEYTSDNHDLSITTPVVETLFQTPGIKDNDDTFDNDIISNELFGLFFYDNEFITESDLTSFVGTNYSLVEIAAKVDSSYLEKELSNINVELVQSIFDNITVAFPNSKKTSEDVQRAFLEAMIGGQFEYNPRIVGNHRFDTDENKNKDITTVKKTDTESKSNSFLGKLKKSSDTGIQKIASLITLENVGLHVGDKDISSEKVKNNEQYVASISDEDLNYILRSDTYGLSNREVNIKLKSSQDNSLIKGEINIHVVSKNINKKIDVSEINSELVSRIKDDFSDLNINKYNTVNEVTGYIINKINDVIYDENKKYSNDSEIAKFLRDFTLNNPITSSTIALKAWNDYESLRTIDNHLWSQIYEPNSKFDGSRPLGLLDEQFEINNTTYKDEAAIRSNMGWGFQSKNKNEIINAKSDDKKTFTLNNIVLTCLLSDYISSNRTEESLIYDEKTRPDGIVHYEYEEPEGSGTWISMKAIEKSVILNIADSSNILSATLPITDSFKTLYTSDTNYNLDVLKSSNLDKWASILENQVIGGNKYSDKTSVYRAFHDMRMQLGIPEDIQIALYKDKFTNNGDLLKNGDSKIQVVVYDALYFSGFESANENDLQPNNNFISNGNYRLINIFFSNVNEKTSKKTTLTILISFFSVLFLIVFGYTVWVSKRKSFYKRATTREMAKMAAYKLKEEKIAKHKNKKNK